MAGVSSPRFEKSGTGAPVPSEVIEQLRSAGYAVVPLRPSEEMLKIGAVHCFQPAEAQNEQTWQNALSDAEDCYRLMVEVGCL